MTYLLIKIAGLLVVAALLGALFARWFFQRHLHDVTSEYTSLRDEWSRWRRTVDDRLSRPMTIDPEPVNGQIKALENAVRTLDIPKPPPPTDLGPVLGAIAAIRFPEPTRVDLDPVMARLEALEQRVGAIRIPSPPPAVDLGPLQARLAEIDAAVRSIVIPPAREPDLAPLAARLASIEDRVGAIRVPPAPPPVDLAPLVARLGALEGRLAALRIPEPPPAVDLTPLRDQLQQVEKAIGAIQIPAPPSLGGVETRLAGLERRLAEARPPEPPKVDLSPLLARVESVERAVRGIVIPAPKEPDFSPLADRLSAMEARLSNLRMPEPSAPIDLAPLHRRIETLDKAVHDIVIPAPREADLTPVLGRLAELEARVAAIRIPEPPPAAPATDLGPVLTRLAELGSAVRGITIPAAASVDLQPVLDRLDAIEGQLAKPPSPAPEPIPRALVRAGSRNLLERPAFGPADDLKLIKGVARVLEGMLHRIGVYYFWQIAEWSRADVAHVDSQLTAFRGRIERDDWVRQAASLSVLPESARKPG